MKIKYLLFVILFLAVEMMSAQGTPKAEGTSEAPPPLAAPRAVPPPPPPPPPPPRKKKIFKEVESMPRFTTETCEDLSKAERNTCTQKEMLAFLYDNMEYPAIAKENGVEGTVVINFVVTKSGEVKEAKIVKDIGAGCGQEALRLVNSMPNWIPGQQRGQPVDAYFNLPVKFEIDDAKE